MTHKETIAHSYAIALMGCQLDDLAEIKTVMANVASLLEQTADKNLAKRYYETLTSTNENN